MQPHHPFIGVVKIVDIDAVDMRDRFLGQEKVGKKKPDSYELLRMGVVDVETIWRAYILNLKLVLSYVEKLLPAFDGRVCITSDHGNSFGRYGVFYGHPPKAFLPELIEVPWLEVCACEE